MKKKIEKMKWRLSIAKAKTLGVIEIKLWKDSDENVIWIGTCRVTAQEQRGMLTNETKKMEEGDSK